jgi:hypothetical protein
MAIIVADELSRGLSLRRGEVAIEASCHGLVVEAS